MRISRFVPAVVASVALLSCRDITAPEPFDGTIELSPDVPAAVSKSIGAEGGTITAQGANGLSYTLAIPENAIPGDEAKTITVTPISSFGGMPLRKAVGVQLSPSGLHFLVPAQLTIAYTSSSPGKKIVGFGSKDDGSEFSIRPVIVEGSSVKFSVSHFSGAGAGELENLELLNAAAASVGGMMVSIQVALLAISNDGELAAAIVAALRSEYTTTVQPALEAGLDPENSGDVILTQEVLSQYSQWVHFVKTELPKFIDIPPPVQAAVQAGIAPDLREADSLAIAVLKAAVNRSNEDCKKWKELYHAADVMRWQQLAQAYGLATAENGLDNTSIMLGLCVRVAYQSVSFPQTLTQGQAASLKVVAGLAYDGASPVYSPPLAVQVTPTGTTQPSPSVGLTNSNGEYNDAFTPAQAGGQVVLGIHTCVDASQYRVYRRLAGVCADQQVTRGTKPVEISLTPTAAALNAGKTAQFTATVTNASNTSVTWSATGGTVSSAGLYTAGSTVGDYEVVARSVADTSKKATAKITIVPVSNPAQSFAGTYKGTGTWVRKSFDAGTQTYVDKEFSGNFDVAVNQLSGNEYGVVIKVFTTPSVPAAYDYYEFGGTINGSGTGSATQTRECFYNGSGTFGFGGPWTSCHVFHHNFTLTISIVNSKASGSFGAKELGDPGVFSFNNLPKQ